MIMIIIIVGIISIWALSQTIFSYNNENIEETLKNQPNNNKLLLKYSKLISVSVPNNDKKFIQIRVCHIPFNNLEQLPDLKNAPIIVLIHGLGGQLNQFEKVINLLYSSCEIIAIDFPGCGLSPIPDPYIFNDDNYKTPLLAELLHNIIIKCTLNTFDPAADNLRNVVLVGHSMGSIIASTYALKYPKHVKGLCLVCPPANELSKKTRLILKYIPIIVFNLFRKLDRKNDLYSKSVNRMLGSTNASISLRKSQLQFNLQVSSKPWLKYASGFTQLSQSQWSTFTNLIPPIPILLIGAQNDKVTPLKDVELIKNSILSSASSSSSSSTSSPHSTHHSTSNHFLIDQITIHNAGHAVLIETPELLCGYLSTFCSERVTHLLSPSWQLSRIAQLEGKWSLKNEAKWRAVPPVSERIGSQNCFFRAMKTLRQDDNIHSPHALEFNNPKSKDIYAIIDISLDAPPYDPNTLKNIKYYKLHTVSKVPVSRKKVKDFIILCNSIFAEIAEQKRHKDQYHNSSNNHKKLLKNALDDQNQKSHSIERDVIAVHCHYGFNRTGFIICSYLIEQLGYSPKQAVNEFLLARPPGIKHAHFIDELFVRYSN